MHVCDGPSMVFCMTLVGPCVGYVRPSCPSTPYEFVLNLLAMTVALKAFSVMAIFRDPDVCFVAMTQVIYSKWCNFSRL